MMNCIATVLKIALNFQPDGTGPRPQLEDLISRTDGERGEGPRATRKRYVEIPWTILEDTFRASIEELITREDSYLFQLESCSKVLRKFSYFRDFLSIFK
jgi:hypothetical protein